MSTHHPLDLDEATAKDMISLATLPYDLLLNILGFFNERVAIAGLAELL